MSKSVAFFLTVCWSLLLGGITTALFFFAPSAVQAALPPACTVRVESNLTTYTSVQDALNVATNGDLLRVSGTCVGTNSVNGIDQVGYITRSVTIQGGYTTTNWLVSDPIAYPTTLNADMNGRVLVISPTVSSAITVENLSLTGGRVIDIDGGGIFITGMAEVLLNQVNIFGNTADWSSDYGYGGGIYNAAVLTVTNSAIYQNYTGDDGGGLYTEVGSTTAVQNSTISGNEAVFSGGGIRSLAPVSITFSTIVANTRGGIRGDNNVTIANSIVAGQSDDCDGVTSNGYNVLGSSCSTVATDISFGGNPFADLLSPLTDNGGATLTHALYPNSVAVDAAEAASCPSRDQRGETRLASECDIGAYEAIIYVTKSVDNPAPGSGERVTYTITMQNPTTGTLTNGQLIDNLPVGVTLAGSVTLQPISGTVGAFPNVVTNISLPVGGVMTATFPMTVTASAGVVITNTAVFTSPDLDTPKSAQVVLKVSNCSARLDSNGVVYTRLQTAINNATAGDVMRVAGVCDFVETVNGTPQVGYIAQDLTVRGGYTTTNWVTSDPIANPTVIDAAGNGRGLRINGAGLTVLVENLTIRNGDATGLGGAQFSSDGGAGVLIEAADTVTLRQVRLHNHLISSADQEEGRGAAVASNNATLNIIDSHLYDNFNEGTYAYGGALFAANGALNITGSHIYQNEAQGVNGDGGAGALGGGVYVDDSASLSVLNSHIYDNVLPNGQGGGLAVDANSTLTMTGSAVYGNEAVRQGGGLYLPRTTAVITQSRIYNNSVNGSTGFPYGLQGGGGLYIESSSDVTIRQTLIASNTVTNRGLGGGVAVNCRRCTNTVLVENSTLSGNTAVEGGGGFSSYIEQDFIGSTNSNITLNHVSIINNNATSGNGHAVNQERETAAPGDVGSVASSFTYRNSLIAGNGGANECRNSATHGTIDQLSGGYNLFIAGAGCTNNGTTDQTVANQATLFSAVVANTLAANNTHPLVNNAFNPAFDAIADTVNGCDSGVSVDQRGAVRADGPDRGDNGCDIGAYELSLETPTAVTWQMVEVRSGGHALRLLPLLLIMGLLLVVSTAVWRSTR